MDVHDFECPGNHQGKAKCNCMFPCLLCGQKGHHARSHSCPKQADIVKLFDSSPPPTKRSKTSHTHKAAGKASLCKVDPTLNVSLTESVKAGIEHSQRMASVNNLEFDISDPLGLRMPSYGPLPNQEEFERQHLEDDRQAAVARNIADDENLPPAIREDAQAHAKIMHLRGWGKAMAAQAERH